MQVFPMRNDDNRLKDIEATLTNISLIEKDFQSKYELFELNMNSIKRNMELELNIAIKKLVIPIQKSIEQYMQSAEIRINKLEDVVLSQIKKESIILSDEKANKLRHSILEDAKEMLKLHAIDVKSHDIVNSIHTNDPHDKRIYIETFISESDNNRENKGDSKIETNLFTVLLSRFFRYYQYTE